MQKVWNGNFESKTFDVETDVPWNMLLRNTENDINLSLPIKTRKGACLESKMNESYCEM